MLHKLNSQEGVFFLPITGSGTQVVVFVGRGLGGPGPWVPPYLNIAKIIKIVWNFQDIYPIK